MGPALKLSNVPVTNHRLDSSAIHGSNNAAVLLDLNFRTNLGTKAQPKSAIVSQLANLKLSSFKC